MPSCVKGSSKESKRKTNGRKITQAGKLLQKRDTEQIKFLPPRLVGEPESDFTRWDGNVLSVAIENGCVKESVVDLLENAILAEEEEEEGRGEMESQPGGMFQPQLNYREKSVIESASSTHAAVDGLALQAVSVCGYSGGDSEGNDILILPETEVNSQEDGGLGSNLEGNSVGDFSGVSNHFEGNEFNNMLEFVHLEDGICAYVADCNQVLQSGMLLDENSILTVITGNDQNMGEHNEDSLLAIGERDVDFGAEIDQIQQLRADDDVPFEIDPDSIMTDIIYAESLDDMILPSKDVISTPAGDILLHSAQIDDNDNYLRDSIIVRDNSGDNYSNLMPLSAADTHTTESSLEYYSKNPSLENNPSVENPSSAEYTTTSEMDFTEETFREEDYAIPELSALEDSLDVLDSIEEEGNLDSNSGMSISAMEESALLVTCRCCDKTISMAESKRHMEEQAAKGYYKCDECLEIFVLQRDFESHMTGHAAAAAPAATLMACSHCGLRFKSEPKLWEHTSCHRKIVHINMDDEEEGGNEDDDISSIVDADFLRTAPNIGQIKVKTTGERSEIISIRIYEGDAEEVEKTLKEAAQRSGSVYYSLEKEENSGEKLVQLIEREVLGHVEYKRNDVQENVVEVEDVSEIEDVSEVEKDSELAENVPEVQDEVPAEDNKRKREEDEEEDVESKKAREADIKRAKGYLVMGFECGFCKTNVDDLPQFAEHLKTHQPGIRGYGIKEVFKCSYCKNLSFLSIRELSAHVNKHIPEEVYVCGRCHEQFTSKESYVDHIKNHPVDKPKLPPPHTQESHKKGRRVKDPRDAINPYRLNTQQAMELHLKEQAAEQLQQLERAEKGERDGEKVEKRPKVMRNRLKRPPVPQFTEEILNYKSIVEEAVSEMASEVNAADTAPVMVTPASSTLVPVTLASAILVSANSETLAATAPLALEESPIEVEVTLEDGVKPRSDASSKAAGSTGKEPITQSLTITNLRGSGQIPFVLNLRNISSWRCGTCKASFKTKDELLVHTDVHKDVNATISQITSDPNFCIYCNKRMETITDIINHIRMHTDEKKRKPCFSCGKVNMAASDPEFVCILCRKKDDGGFKDINDAPIMKDQQEQTEISL